MSNLHTILEKNVSICSSSGFFLFQAVNVVVNFDSGANREAFHDNFDQKAGRFPRDGAGEASINSHRFAFDNILTMKSYDLVK